jgi:hypothetical protein
MPNLKQILNCRDAVKVIFENLPVADHISLTKAMTVYYSHYIFTSLNREKRRPISETALISIPLRNLKDQTLDFFIKCIGNTFLCVQRWTKIS